ncbi:acyl-CoA dehydrogenase [Pseudomonas soli]|uniref:DUF6285 domain-containing protein n=1 Tax=Pseudomonas soli TaxID=1306993 RepID=A0AAJ5MGM7_9PSED|nr:DUF6285 domain-containing protein [Pseudomonas soli]AIN58212.1 acyl-CoA dehydrogenase [Pseudomonas soli]PYC41663.1 acyl-CoA dehydrogenase [Pseudomonas soli]UXZ43878.1 DUF6285 domain-containing protein [Pseudomonas soli]
MTQPNAAQLLDIARQTLLEQVLPELSGELRYPALMIANAMAIAARESRLQGELEVQEHARLGAVLEAPPATLAGTRQHLAQTIREGRHDAPQARRALVEALRQTTLERLAISNPKAMP